MKRKETIPIIESKMNEIEMIADLILKKQFFLSIFTLLGKTHVI